MTNQRIIIASLFAVLLSVVAGCEKKGEAEGYEVAGRIKGIPNNTKIYLFNMETQSNMDSAMVVKELFTMKGQIDHPTHCVLIVPDQNKYADLILENHEISFESIYDDFYFQRKVQGGPEQDLKNRLWELTGEYDTKYLKISDSLSNQLFADEHHKKELMAKHDKYVTKSKELMRDFIVKNPNSYFTLDLLYRNRKFIPKSTLEGVITNLELQYANIPDALALAEYVSGIEVELKEGDKIADFEGITLDGEFIKLSSFGGNYVYLSFWSRGCKPCRVENRFFSENFETIPNALKIVSFSTDKDQKVWETASKEDSIRWTNLSAKGKMHDSIVKLYSVQALPVSFLIDKNGIIMKKFEGYNDEHYETILETISADKDS
nr:TlpA disulfide reductase family protein [Allomuricauda sp.]